MNQKTEKIPFIVRRHSSYEKSFERILAPFRQQVEESGIEDAELDSLFRQARRDYVRERGESYGNRGTNKDSL
jgi:hypothetical protein